MYSSVWIKIDNIFHHFYLCSEALYVVTSFIQQSAKIHPFSAWHELPETVFLHWTHFSVVSWFKHCSFLQQIGSTTLSLRQITTHLALPDLAKKGSRPRPFRPNRRSHGCIGRSPYHTISLVSFSHGNRWRRCIHAQFLEGPDESMSKPSFNGTRVSEWRNMIRSHGNGGQETRKVVDNYKWKKTFRVFRD